MPEYLAPGVYIEEIEIGAKSIEGVSTSTAAFIGETERGPTTPKLTTGLEEYRRVFGSYGWRTEQGDSSSYMRHAVEGFFANGGKRCFVARVVGANSKAAAAWIDLAKIVGAEGRLAGARNDTGGEQSTSSTSDLPSSLSPESQDSGRKNPGRKKDSDGAQQRGPIVVVSAIGPGSWGDRIWLYIEAATLQRAGLFKLTVEYWKNPETDEAPWLQESYDNISVQPGSPDYIERRINGYSSLITVSMGSSDGSGAAAPDLRPDARPPKPVSEKNSKGEKIKPIVEGALANGSDGERVNLDSYKGEGKIGERTGLMALGEVDEINIVCAPNETDVKELTNELVTHCENLKDRFVILQSPLNLTADVGEMRPPKDSKYAAYYFPWIKVVDGGTGVPIPVPPGGHLAGIYARTDIERGVFKAPANEVVRGAVGLQFQLTHAEQEILNPRGVNCIRAFPARGIRVWGARTTSTDPLWKYVNVRRLFLYLEESIEESTQWVVFEPNDQRLWARVRQGVNEFLLTVWRAGGLMGRTADEAFFVKCDETTMTRNDIENGRLIIVIGVAPVRPADFVIFRIAQWRGGSTVEE